MPARRRNPVLANLDTRGKIYEEELSFYILY